MTVFAGPVWHNGEAADGWMQASGGKITDEGVGSPPAPAQAAVLLDGIVDLHTHVGDAFLRGEPLPRDLAALVAPVTGLKHRRLATTPPEAVQAGIHRHLQDLARHGVVDVLDFREQGEAGLRVARDAAHGVPGLRLRLLGRPATTSADPTEVGRLLAAADGLGIPSLTDLGFEACERLREVAHAGGKPFAMHASEGVREDIERVLALEPDLLVHLASATRQDLRRVAEEGIPVVVCPISNDFFGLRPPLDAFHSIGVEWYLGTDNAMLGNDDPVREAAKVREWFPQLPESELLRALTTRPGKVLNQFAEHAGPATATRVRVLPRASSGITWSAPVTVLER